LHVTDVKNERIIKNKQSTVHTSLIETSINNKLKEEFKIENYFQIWTINRILVILKFLKIHLYSFQIGSFRIYLVILHFKISETVQNSSDKLK